MKRITLLIYFVSCVLTNVWSAWNKYDEEDNKRPYEFGFNLQNYQHRHEKKDTNGIVMGEFGFVTADNVYHVTVYATDQNGAFKIISMKSFKLVDGPERKAHQGTPIKYSQQPLQVSASTIIPIVATTSTPEINSRILLNIPTPKPSIIKTCSSCKLPEITTPPPPSIFIPNAREPKTKDFFLNESPEKKMTAIDEAQFKTITQTGTNRINDEVLTNGLSPRIIEMPENINDINLQSSPEVQYDSKYDELQSTQQTSTEEPIVSNQNQNRFTTSTEISIKVTQNISPIKQFQSENKSPAIETMDNPDQTTPLLFETTTFKTVSGTARPTQIELIDDIPITQMKLYNESPTIQKNKAMMDVELVKPVQRTTSSPTTTKIPKPVNNPMITTRFGDEEEKYIPKPIKLENELLITEQLNKFPNQPSVTDSRDFYSPLNEMPQYYQPFENTDPVVSDLNVVGLLNEILYRFNYTAGFHAHHEEGDRRGNKEGGYNFIGRDGYRRVVDYKANENGYMLRFRLEYVQPNEIPRPESEQERGSQGYEFKWFYLKKR